MRRPNGRGGITALAVALSFAIGGFGGGLFQALPASANSLANSSLANIGFGIDGANSGPGITSGRNNSSSSSNNASNNNANGGANNNANIGAADPRPTISPLSVRPIIADTSWIIVDKLAAQQLGKAFFWDSQAGSDGQACASCHFHAGADLRNKNQINPGITTFADSTFHVRQSSDIDPSPTTGPNVALGPNDFPFHHLEDPDNRNSRIIFDTNDRFTSQGTFGGTFVESSVTPMAQPQPGIAAASPPVGLDNCIRAVDPTDPFNNGSSLMYRRVEPRNTPSVVNAAFNARQFWDGRANNIFNGVDPFGHRTNIASPAAGILVSESVSGLPALVKTEIANASLASQAVGPATSPFEMSCAGRTFSDLGRRLLSARALAGQAVHPEDSLFSRTVGLINTTGPGLNTTYADLVRKAFQPKYWRSDIRTTITSTGAVQSDPANGFNQMEHNFSFFWGLAIQEYEAILISNQSKFDRGMLDQTERKGMQLFTGKGNCVLCHSGPLLSAAALAGAESRNPERVERMIMGDGSVALYDHGFYNIGVRPSFEDRGIGGLDGTSMAFDLSYSRQYKWKLLGRNDRVGDKFDVASCSLNIPFDPRNCYAVPQLNHDPANAPRDAVDGSFKVPILRNVGLTPPYFHNGGQANLHEVVDFYSRGGDRRGPLNSDTTGYPLSDQAIDSLLAGADVPSNLSQPPNSFGQTTSTNLAPNIGDPNGSHNNALRLSQDEKDALVAFLLSLTDPRVACHSDVFDHPELILFAGNNPVPAAPGSPMAQDIKLLLPAVGRRGLATCFPNTGDLYDELQTLLSVVTPVP
jgi:cytochrome c peroxidase